MREGLRPRGRDPLRRDPRQVHDVHTQQALLEARWLSLADGMADAC